VCDDIYRCSVKHWANRFRSDTETENKRTENCASGVSPFSARQSSSSSPVSIRRGSGGWFPFFPALLLLLGLLLLELSLLLLGLLLLQLFLLLLGLLLLQLFLLLLGSLLLELFLLLLRLSLL